MFFTQSLFGQQSSSAGTDLLGLLEQLIKAQSSVSAMLRRAMCLDRTALIRSLYTGMGADQDTVLEDLHHVLADAHVHFLSDQHARDGVVAPRHFDVVIAMHE
jgi:hypothetical protein